MASAIGISGEDRRMIGRGGFERKRIERSE
jgi:hypothetical protein